MVDHNIVRPGDSAIRRLLYAQAELDRTPASGGMGDGFLVDPERAEAALAQLDRAILDIRQSLNAFSISAVPPPARDEVSMNLARQIAVMDTRAQVYVRAWADQLQEFRDAVQAQVDAYRRVDDENAGQLS